MGEESVGSNVQLLSTDLYEVETNQGLIFNLHKAPLAIAASKNTIKKSKLQDFWYVLEFQQKTPAKRPRKLES